MSFCLLFRALNKSTLFSIFSPDSSIDFRPIFASSLIVFVPSFLTCHGLSPVIFLRIAHGSFVLTMLDTAGIAHPRAPPIATDVGDTSHSVSASNLAVSSTPLAMFFNASRTFGAFFHRFQTPFAKSFPIFIFPVGEGVRAATQKLAAHSPNCAANDSGSTHNASWYWSALSIPLCTRDSARASAALFSSSVFKNLHGLYLFTALNILTGVSWISSVPIPASVSHANLEAAHTVAAAPHHTAESHLARADGLSSGVVIVG